MHTSMRMQEGMKNIMPQESEHEPEAITKLEEWIGGQYCLKKIEEMTDLAYQIIPNWPAVFRYTRGEKILQILDEMEDRCITAHLKYYKKTTLQELDILNHKLQLKIRDARRKTYTDRSGKRRTLLQPGGYERWAGLSVETGKIIGSWIEKQKEKGKEKDSGQAAGRPPAEE